MITNIFIPIPPPQKLNFIFIYLRLPISANIVINIKAITAPNVATIGANFGRHDTKVIHIRPNPSVIMKV